MFAQRRLLSVLILLSVSLSPGSWAQDPDIPEDELIVRLRPFPEAPRPEEVVDAVNQVQPVPGGLGAGGPHFAELLLPARLQGPMKDFYDENYFFPRARLERSVVLHYATPQDASDVLAALAINPNVEFVEVNRPLYLVTAPEDPSLPPPADAFLPGSKILDGDCESELGVIPDDPLFAPPVDDCNPTKYQWGSYAMRLPEAWQYVRGHAKVLLVDMGLQTDHPDLKAFGPAGPFNDAFIGGNFRPHLSYNYKKDRCDVGETDPVDQVYAVHGSHTSGIVAATPNNGEGWPEPVGTAPW